jgi:hypothetical protein
MSNNKPISVKVKTDKLMTALTEALTSRTEEAKAHAKAEKDYEKAIKEWETKVIDYIKSGKAKVSDISSSRNWRSETEEAKVTITLPASLAFPQRENNLRPLYELKMEIEELENALALLKMSDDEFINASTYKGVARLIK